MCSIFYFYIIHYPKGINKKKWLLLLTIIIIHTKAISQQNSTILNSNLYENVIQHRVAMDGLLETVMSENVLGN